MAVQCPCWCGWDSEMAIFTSLIVIIFATFHFGKKTYTHIHRVRTGTRLASASPCTPRPIIGPKIKWLLRERERERENRVCKERRWFSRRRERRGTDTRRDVAGGSNCDANSDTNLGIGAPGRGARCGYGLLREASGDLLVGSDNQAVFYRRAGAGYLLLLASGHSHGPRRSSVAGGVGAP